MLPVPPDSDVLKLLAEIEEDEALSTLVGVDLTPAAPDPSHAPMVYLPLDEWLCRSEEVHRFLRAAQRAERERDRR